LKRCNKITGWWKCYVRYSQATRNTNRWFHRLFI